MLLFNRYQYDPTTDLIGKGEFTRVYEALDTTIYLPVAVKIYQATEPGEKFGFVHVNKFMGLDHPNICRYLHIGDILTESASGEQEKMQACVMELLQDGDFASYYQAHPQLELLRKMVLDILHGLTYLHSQRIVHRRLKASNLLVGMTTQGPVVKITDFGLGSGKAASRDARISSMVVEVTRMAPEQFNAREYGVNGGVSYHFDFWSLGMAVYEALTDNDLLFMNSPTDSREQVIRNILSPRVPEKILRLPAPFDQFVLRCLAKHAEDRPYNSRELIELLAQPITTIYPVHDQPTSPVVTPPKNDKEKVLEGNAAAVMTETAAMVEEAVEKADPARPEPTQKKEVAPFFKRYEYNPKLALMGKGGFSRVYKAFDKKLDRWVALKFYKTGEYSERYSPIAEIRRVINLDHPNICRYLDIEELEKEDAFGQKETAQVSVMELLDGGNLHDYFAAHPSFEVLKKLLTDVLNGLAYLHRNGIIHRDIKPANILIKETAQGPVAKITDFGVSRCSDSTATNSRSALVVSIPYMAPEQLNVKNYGVEEKIGYNLDLWALGVTIYEVINGEVLFKNTEKDTNEEIMANILAPGLQNKIAGLPQPFLDVVRRCLVKDARRRAQGAEELIELLNRPMIAPKLQTKEKPPIEEVRSEPGAAPAAKAGTIRVETGSLDSAASSIGPQASSRGAEAESIVVQASSMGPQVSSMGAQVSSMGAEAGSIRAEAASTTDTQELFAPEKSWLWAESLQAPKNGAITGRDPGREMGSPRVRIAIVSATVLLAIATYIVTQNHRYSNMLHPLPPVSDAVNILHTSHTGGAQPSGTAVRAVQTTTVPEGVEENKERGIAWTPAKYVLMLTTSRTCSIDINHTPYGVLENGKLMKVYLPTGDYTIRATSIGNHPGVYTQRLVVKNRDLNHSRKYRIRL